MVEHGQSAPQSSPQSAQSSPDLLSHIETIDADAVKFAMVKHLTASTSSTIIVSSPQVTLAIPCDAPTSRIDGATVTVEDEPVTYSLVDNQQPKVDAPFVAHVPVAQKQPIGTEEPLPADHIIFTLPDVLIKVMKGLREDALPLMLSTLDKSSRIRDIHPVEIDAACLLMASMCLMGTAIKQEEKNLGARLMQSTSAEQMTKGFEAVQMLKDLRAACKVPEHLNTFEGVKAAAAQTSTVDVSMLPPISKSILKHLSTLLTIVRSAQSLAMQREIECIDLKTLTALTLALDLCTIYESMIERLQDSISTTIKVALGGVGRQVELTDMQMLFQRMQFSNEMKKIVRSCLYNNNGSTSTCVKCAPDEQIPSSSGTCPAGPAGPAGPVGPAGPAGPVDVPTSPFNSRSSSDSSIDNRAGVESTSVPKFQIAGISMMGSENSPMPIDFMAPFASTVSGVGGSEMSDTSKLLTSAVMQALLGSRA